MPEISLTSFVDFTLKAGLPKVTLVRQLKNQPAYSPEEDYWLPLRNAIKTMHRSGSSPTSLDKVLAGVHPKKEASYQQRITSYKGWMRRKHFEWADPPTVVWEHQDLSVRINPELGLKIDGVPHLVKLYFKGESPSRLRLSTAAFLMQTALGTTTGTSSIMDIAKGKLHVLNTFPAGTDALLEAEAGAFLAIWNRI